MLFRSRDQGKTWDKISPDLTRNDKSKQHWSGGPITGDNTGVEYYGTIFAIAESPKKAGVLWAGSDDGLVHVSKDDGKSWKNVTKQIPDLPTWATVSCIEASPHDPARAYVVAHNYRLDDDRPYFWSTSDYGETWTKLTEKLPSDEILRVVREDPKAPGLLYVGSERGVWYSRDHGKIWFRLKLNLPTAIVTDLAVKDNDLVVGTSGRSVWILDDLTPVREWTTKLATEAHFFAVQPATRWRYHGENYALEDRIPGSNPPRGAILTYHLPAVPKDELSLEIIDRGGNIVQKLSSKKPNIVIDEDAPDVPWSIFKPTVLPKEHGLNRVAWNLEMMGPKIIPGAKNDAGVPYRGPMVLPGTYTLRLLVDRNVLTQKVEVKPDPRYKSKPADWAEAHKLALQLRDDITKCSEIVIALQSVRRQIKERAKALDGDSNSEQWVKNGKLVIGKLDELEDKLHNPKAEVTYDILAKKGGAKLYSQLAPLYDTVKDSDGPVTQGMREVYQENAKALARLDAEWKRLVADPIMMLNKLAGEMKQATILVPK
jgi:hypothetical protein